jgi:DNA polymerase III subunit gamma/tau
MYQALYRQWRPQSFADIVGQEHVTRTLQNALEQDRLAHAYLFCGPRGTGKTSAAKILAKAVNCENGPVREPCNQCPACLGIQAGRVMDVLEIDAASNRGIDDIRDLRDKVRYSPVEVRRKVYIVDEVHMLSQEAFNALLKTLEEPPGRVIFVLATTEPHKLPATIISRCQRLDFRLIGITEIAERLRLVAQDTGRPVHEEALFMIAEQAAGGLRDALSLLEQVLAYTAGEVAAEDVLAVLGAVGRDIYFALTEALINKDMTKALLLLQEVATGGKDLHHFTQQAIAYYRDLMVAFVCGEQAETLGISPDWTPKLSKQAGRLGLGAIGSILTELHTLLAEIRWSSRPRLLWELAIFRILGGDNQADTLVNPASPPAPARYKPEPLPGGQAHVREAAAVAATRPRSAMDKADDPANLTRVWPRVMELLKKESIKTHALLLSAELGTTSGKLLELCFDADIHCEMMDSPENKKPLLSVLKKVCGTEPAIRCVKTGNGIIMPAVEKDPDELLTSAVEIFNGRVIDKTERS